MGICGRRLACFMGFYGFVGGLIRVGMLSGIDLRVNFRECKIYASKTRNVCAKTPFLGQKGGAAGWPAPGGTNVGMGTIGLGSMNAFWQGAGVNPV